MTEFSRPARRPLLAIFSLCFALGTASSALAQTVPNPLAMRVPSATGSFLAGQQAIRDLHSEEAARFFLDAAEADWDNIEYVNQAFLALMANGQMEDARAIAQHVLEVEPKNEMARLLMGAVALKERRFQSAISQLDDVRGLSFIGITASLLEGWAAIAGNDYNKAKALLDDLSRAGLDEFLLYHRALMADVAGQRDEAIEYAATAYDLDPYVATVVEMYVRMLGNASRFEEAQAVIDDFYAQGLSHPLIDEVAKSIADKVRPGKMASNAHDGAAEMFLGVGVALGSDASSELAVILLRLGQYMRPGDDVLTMALGDIYDRAGQHDLANEVHAKLPAASPLKTTANIRIAQNLDELGDHEEAIRRLSNIANANPDNVDAAASLGDFYRYDEQYDQAIEAYTKVLDIVGGDHPADWRYHYVRGIAYERAGEWPKAEADFKRALELNPDQPQVLNYLGFTWVDQGVHLEEALDMIKKAVDASPGDGYIVDSLGWAYYRMGRYDDAVKTLEQAVQMLPNDPEINDHLGDVYWKVGRKIEARFQWTIAADVDKKNGNVTERARVKLANGLDGAE